MLFPAPLVPFEDYLLTDDRADHPMTFFYRMKFRGSLDQEAFRSALEIALSRHPLLSVVLRPGRNGRPVWKSANGLRPQVHWDHGRDLDACPDLSAVDLQKEVGLRVYVNSSDDESVVLFQFHHVCCDGLGAMRFLEDLLVAYHAVVRGIDPESLFRPLEPGRLNKRGEFGRSFLRRVLQSPKMLLGLIGHGLLGTYEYFAHSPLELPPPKQRGSNLPSCNGSGNATFPMCQHTFTAAETSRWRKAAKASGCTANDLLLRDLYLGLGNWVKRHDPNERKHYLRIMVPVSLRRGDDHLLPAANRVSMVFLDRKHTSRCTPGELLDGVRREMHSVKRYDLGLALLHGIGIARKLPGGLKNMLREEECLATALLTNVLDPTLRIPLPRHQRKIAAGDLLLESLVGFAPRRPKTYACFGAIMYAGRLSISLSYDRQHLGPGGGEELLDIYVRQIRTSMDSLAPQGRFAGRSSGSPLPADPVLVEQR
jgi:hypothetical protein